MQHILSMPQNAGLYSLPPNMLTAGMREMMSAAQQHGGGLLTGPFAGAGLPGLANPYGMQSLQYAARPYAGAPGYGGGLQQIALMLANDTPGFGRRGDSITLALHPTDVHVAEELDTYLAGYSPAEFRADEAVPIVPVTQLTNLFRLLTKNNAFRLINVLASAQSDINEVDPETQLGTYQCIDRAIGGFVPAVTQYVATKAFDPRQALGRRIAWALGLDREVRVFGGTTGLLTNSANWASNCIHNITGGSEWDTTSGDPIKDLQTAEESSVMPITDWWMSTQSFNAFLRNQKVRDLMRQMLGDNAPAGDIVARARDIVIPGFAPIHKVEGKVLDDSTGALNFIMTDRVVGTHTPVKGAQVNPEDIQTAVTFRFDGPSGTGFITREFELPRRGLYAGSMMVSGYSEDTKFIGNDCGALITNTLSTI